jgi:hypothetical protein
METDFNNEVSINIDYNIELSGELIIPHHAGGIVIFSHGSGSSRHSPRNKIVAQRLQQNQIGTFLFDLLTPEEDRNYSTRFDIELLTRRLVKHYTMAATVSTGTTLSHRLFWRQYRSCIGPESSCHSSANQNGYIAWWPTRSGNACIAPCTGAYLAYSGRR